MTTVSGLMTAEDLWKLPEDGTRHELRTRKAAPCHLQDSNTGTSV